MENLKLRPQDYTEYQYLWPPRPETKAPPNSLNFYEQRGYWAQRKKNGTRTVIFTCGDRVIFKTRHGDEANHEQWQPLPAHLKFFRGIGKAWNVFDAELVHSKVGNGPRNFLYIFDQLVSDSMSLVGWTLEQRQALLYKRFGVEFELYDDVDIDHQLVDHDVGVARNFLPGVGFNRVFEHRAPEDEGLVLKRPNAKLQPCVRPASNSNWQIKCRAPKTNYSF